MRRLWLAVAVLAAIRVGITVAQLAHADLPGLPRVAGHALSGDATGYYAGAREVLAAPARLPRPLLALLALLTVAVAVAVVAAWRRRPAWRPWLLLAALWWLGLLLAVDAAEQRFSGAPVAGWPIVWAVAAVPLRALGRLDPRTAFWPGLVVQLACNAAVVVATAVVALRATASRAVALVAAALYAFWPFLFGALAGHGAWGNGTWDVDAGLHMYTEPLSTALVVVALALLLAPRLGPASLVAAGACLGFATATRLSNVVVAVAAAALVAWRCRGDRVAVGAYAAGGLAFAPLVLVYWRLGYTRLYDLPGYAHVRSFSASYLVRSWTDSLLFTPRTLAVLVPVAVLGALAVRGRFALAALAVWTLANPLLYSVYWYTPIHPRFLWASLPSLFVLWAGGAVLLVRSAGEVSRERARRAAPRSP